VKQQKSDMWHGITCIDRTLEEYIDEAKLSISVFPLEIRNVDVANCVKAWIQYLTDSVLIK
jgi:hypothetical protein